MNLEDIATAFNTHREPEDHIRLPTDPEQSEVFVAFRFKDGEACCWAYVMPDGTYRMAVVAGSLNNPPRHGIDAIITVLQRMQSFTRALGLKEILE